MRPEEAVVPAARSHGLVVERMAGETLVYDTERDEVHHLDRIAAAVFELCDGRTSASEVAGRAGERLGEAVSERSVLGALALLSERDLVHGEPAADAGVSRREAVRRAALIGAAAAGAPMIRSIVAPSPAQAASPQTCAGVGDPCTQNSDCCGCGFNCACRDDQCTLLIVSDARLKRDVAPVTGAVGRLRRIGAAG
jgi:hypothetical protein